MAQSISQISLAVRAKLTSTLELLGLGNISNYGIKDEHLAAFIFSLLGCTLLAAGCLVVILLTYLRDARKVDSSHLAFWQQTFVVRLYGQMFATLFKLTPYKLPEYLLDVFVPGPGKYRLPEIWVLFNFILCILALCLVIELPGNSMVLIILAIWGPLRVYEVLVVLVNLLVFDQFRIESEAVDARRRSPYQLRDRRRTLILLAHNYVEIILWFAFLYLFFATSFSYAYADGGRVIDNPALNAIYSSFKVMTSFGYENVKPTDNLGYALIMIEAFMGLFMTIGVIARFLSILPVPTNTGDHQS